jgi:predicted nucleic acid-binding protein
MSILVVDACIGTKWFFEEIYTEHAVRILDDKYTLHAPDLFLLEITNLLCKRIRRREITRNASDEIRKALTQLPVNYHDENQLIDSAYEIAITTGSSLYDCIYIALAILLDCQMVTSDKRLVDNITNTPFNKHILWIEDVE